MHELLGRYMGVVVMTWWWALALLALATPARPAPRAGNGELLYSYQMSRKSCEAGGARGACMWVQECNRLGGRHAGVCVDRFMFGSCCLLPEKPIVVEEAQQPVTVTITSRPPAPPSVHSTTHPPVEVSTQTIARPNWQTQRPSFMTKPIDGAPTSYSYRPPEISLPSLDNLDSSSEKNSDIVHKIPYNSVNKYQNVNRPSGEEASPNNKISSSLSLLSGARPMAVHEQHAREYTIHVKAEQPEHDPLASHDGAVVYNQAAAIELGETGGPKEPTSDKTEESTPATIQTTAATNSVECGVTAMWPRPETRIMGGKDSSFGRWPWQVSVRRTSFFGFSSTHRCGGAIINEGWIATAGHCVDDLLTSQIRIRVGEYDFSSVSEQYPFVERGVARKAVHPKYNFFTYEYDLALVKLESPVQFAPHISPICLPASDDLLVGENATVTGWGRLSEGGVLPSILQEVQVPIVSNERCKSMFLMGREARVHPGHLPVRRPRARRTRLLPGGSGRASA
ncbi:hypothetical protein ACJJTC_001629, partial [Scirpophaga incertulas]